MFIVFFTVVFPHCGLAGLGYWSLWSCKAFGHWPFGRGRRSSWLFVYMLLSSHVAGPICVFLFVGQRGSTDFFFSKAEVGRVLLLFYFYVHDFFRMLRSASASCCLFWKSLTVSVIVFGVYNLRPAGARGVLMLILSCCFKTLRNIPCLI